MKQILKSDFEKLLKNNIIKNGSIEGNIKETGKFSSGFYDVKKYNKLLKLYPNTSSKQLMEKSHIGVSITASHKIIIEDKYAEIAKSL